MSAGACVLCVIVCARAECGGDWFSGRHELIQSTEGTRSMHMTWGSSECVCVLVCVSVVSVAAAGNIYREAQK